MGMRGQGGMGDTPGGDMVTPGSGPTPGGPIMQDDQTPADGATPGMFSGFKFGATPGGP